MATSKSRAYDSLYDPSYTVSGARDHYREQSKANGLYVERVPDYSNFFSELPTHPSSSYRFKLNDKVPQHVPREYVPSGRSQNELSGASRPHEVSGSNRYKYFRRPLLMPIAGMGAVDQSTSLTMPLVSSETAKGASAFNHQMDGGIASGATATGSYYFEGVGEVMGGISRTVATQSDYRESETQTIAYEPDYVLPERMSLKQKVLDEKFHLHGIPETLIMKDLGIVTGLTPGVAEVEALERARAKRAFEGKLPPLNDMNKIGLRQRMMSSWEHHEMEMRDDELKRLQEERLAILEDALRRREEAREAMTAARIDAKCETLIASKEKTFSNIQTRRVKAIRKLATKRSRANQNFKGTEQSKNNIIENYNNFGSKVYAPLNRVGFCPNISHNVSNHFDARQESDVIDKLNKQLQETSSAALLETISNLKANTAKSLSREENVVQSQIKYISDLLEASKAENQVQHDASTSPPKPTVIPPSIATTTAAAAVTTTTTTTTAGPGAAPDDVSSPTFASAATDVFRQHHHRKSERPETPSVPDRSADLARHRAVVLLQRLLRGRADQMDRFDGKERRLELIRELRLPMATATGTGTGAAVATAQQTGDGHQRGEQAAADLSAQAARGGLAEEDEGEQGDVRLRVVTASKAEEQSMRGGIGLEVERVVAREMMRMMRILATSDPAERTAALSETAFLRERLEAERQYQAALRIQAAERGRRARIEVSKMKKELESESATLQEEIATRTIRSLLEIAALEASMKEEAIDTAANEAVVDGIIDLMVDDVVQEESGDFVKVFDVDTLREENEAAIKIQSLHRGRMARKEAQKLKENAALLASITAEDQAKVVKIQAGVRGYHQRKRFKRQQEAAKEKALLQEQCDAAVKIQSVHRGRMARKEALKMKEKSALLASMSEEDQKKIVKIQAGIRGYHQRKHFNKQRELKKLTDEMTEEDVQKVVKIQAGVRGHLVRKSNLSGHKASQDDVELSETATSAPTAMQKRGSGSVKDPDVMDEEIAVLKIQSHIRGHLARKEAEKRRQLRKETNV